ncbi:MAG: hypothetical protein KC652_23185 [Cyanobacteria bacterium HKST-UBA01]|nr:hypothetical protein [Cyanobacteria bacterium HKST-UBA01]
MTRTAIFCMIVFLFAGMLVCSKVSDPKKKALPAIRLSPPDRVVLVVQDIAEGSPVLAKSLEERHLALEDIPYAAVCEIEAAVGKKARYAISAGQVLSIYDLDPGPTPPRLVSVMATKNIPKGSTIRSGDLEEFEFPALVGSSAGYLPAQKGVGKKAKYEIPKGAILSVNSFEP